MENQIFDLVGLMDRVDGDIDIIKELVDLFFSEFKIQDQQLQEFFNAQNLQCLMISK